MISLGVFAALVVAVALAFPELCQRRLPCSESEAQVTDPVASPPPPPRLASPPRPTLVSVVRDAGAARAEQPTGEHELLVQIRGLAKSDPPRAEALARQSRSRFPEGPEADERDALLVDALINQQRIGAARDETYYYFDHHPQGRFAEHLFTMTGVHPSPRRNGR